MSSYRAAFQPFGCEQPFLLHRPRARHCATMYSSREKALRALDRAGAYHGGGRGFVWPVAASPSLTAADLSQGMQIPAYVETVAL